MNTRTVIWDLDGTLNLALGDKIDWSKFEECTERMIGHKPNWPMIQLLKSISEAHHVIMTARPERFRRVTDAWLHAYGIAYSTLLMRSDDDMRPDAQVKKDLLGVLISREVNIWFAVDDRDKNVAMFRENGIMCLQASPGGMTLTKKG